MVDLYGKEVLNEKRNLKKGSNIITLETNTIPAGMYALCIESGGMKPGYKTVIKK